MGGDAVLNAEPIEGFTDDPSLFEGMLSVRSVIEAFQRGKSNRRVIRVYFDRERAEKKERDLKYLKEKQKELSFALELTDREFIDGLCLGTTHGGVVAECTGRDYSGEFDKDFMSGGFFVLLDGVEDPYNFGYSLRSLMAAGVSGLLLPPRNWLSAAGTVCRSSAGASELMDIRVADPLEAVRFFRSRGVRIVCSSIKRSVSVYDAVLKTPLLLVIGGEKRGISASILELADDIVRLDYGSRFRCSLSSASASAVLAFEIARQNNFFRK